MQDGENLVGGTIELHLQETKTIGQVLMVGELVKELGQTLGKVVSLVGISGVVVLTTHKVVDIFTLKVSYPVNTTQLPMEVLRMVG